MGDLSNKELLISFDNYYDMVTRENEYFKKHGKRLGTVNLIAGNDKDYLTSNALLDMSNRVAKWVKENPGQKLDNVWIKKPANTNNVLVNIASNNVPTVNIKGKNHTSKSFTEFYNLMSSFGYSYYYNDIYTLSQEIKNLTNGKAMNCTDFAQLGVYVASQFVKNGKKVYETRYRHVNCKSGSGHTQFEIRGGEFTKWTIVDLAAKADKDSPVYPIGTGWCANGSVRGYNESWVLVDDGKT